MENDDILEQLNKKFQKQFNPKSRAKYKNDPNLKGKRHIFDKKMHERYDIPARNRIKEVLGDIVIDNPDIYQQDMIIKLKNCKYKYLELQVCADWVIDKFPYPKLYVYERKAKYGKDTLYLTFNRFLDQGKLFDRESFPDKPRRLKKYSREFVYDIPEYRIMDVVIDDMNKDTFKIY